MDFNHNRKRSAEEHSGYYPDIMEFYKDTNILITGGTGFLGKVLIEKLIRSCEGVKSIYLLMRTKRGRNINERLEELVKSEVSYNVNLFMLFYKIK